ncbi:MAG TPA: hypothetical protein VM686_23120, partial [Polyangiaceae bacterium]|nr:hypothetical protein [Polyangiaceae bacterium]
YCFGGTPSNWAFHGKDLDMAKLHAEKSRWLPDASRSGHVALVRELVAEDPGCVAQRGPHGETALHRLPEDPETAQVIIELLLAAGADRDAKNNAGKTPAQALTDDGLDEIADLLEADLLEAG